MGWGAERRAWPGQWRLQHGGGRVGAPAGTYQRGLSRGSAQQGHGQRTMPPPIATVLPTVPTLLQDVHSGSKGTGEVI